MVAPIRRLGGCEILAILGKGRAIIVIFWRFGQGQAIVIISLLFWARGAAGVANASWLWQPRSCKHMPEQGDSNLDRCRHDRANATGLLSLPLPLPHTHMCAHGWVSSLPPGLEMPLPMMPAMWLVEQSLALLTPQNQIKRPRACGVR